MNIRERFEEIWPVPEGVRWSDDFGEYMPHGGCDGDLCVEWDTRLDTFTRCQETTDVYVSLVDEMVKELESCYGQLRMAIAGDLDRFYVSPVLERAKQIMADKK